MSLTNVQISLNSHGFPCGSADGVLGDKTKAAVTRFQQAFCGPPSWLRIDGIPGPQTEAAVNWMAQTNSLVTYFTVPELACRHCGLCYVKRELLSAMFKLREATGPVVVISAYRCLQHNAAIGGAKDSKHPQGLAFDPGSYRSIEQARLAGFGGVGTTDNRRAVHMDIRPGFITFHDTPK